MKIKKSNQKRTLIMKRGKIRPDIGRKVERLSGPGEGGRGKSEGWIGNGNIIIKTVIVNPIGVFPGNHFVNYLPSRRVWVNRFDIDFDFENENLGIEKKKKVKKWGFLNGFDLIEWLINNVIINLVPGKRKEKKRLGICVCVGENGIGWWIMMMQSVLNFFYHKSTVSALLTLL